MLGTAVQVCFQMLFIERLDRVFFYQCPFDTTPYSTFMSVRTLNIIGNLENRIFTLIHLAPQCCCLRLTQKCTLNKLQWTSSVVRKCWFLNMSKLGALNTTPRKPRYILILALRRSYSEKGERFRINQGLMVVQQIYFFFLFYKMSCRALSWC